MRIHQVKKDGKYTGKWYAAKPYTTKMLKLAHKTPGKSEKPRYVGTFDSEGKAILAVKQTTETMAAKTALNAAIIEKSVAATALKQLDSDILYTNLSDWDYLGDDNFKVDIKDKAGNFHRYKYYENEGKTVWRCTQTAQGLHSESPIGAWVGDEEPNGLALIAMVY